MTRGLRVEYPGALYRATSQGNWYQAIYFDDRERLSFLRKPKDNNKRYGTVIHAYVLMDNHFQLIMETPGASLSRSMQTFNTAYTGYFNRRHGKIRASVPEKNKSSANN